MEVLAMVLSRDSRQQAAKSSLRKQTDALHQVEHHLVIFENLSVEMQFSMLYNWVSVCVDGCS